MVGHQVSFPLYDNWLDSLEDRGGELSWVLQKRDFPLNTAENANPTARSLQDIRRSVLASNKVQEVILAEAESRRVKVEDVRKEAEEMLDIMAHKYSLNYVRPFGYVVAKVLKTIFDGIYVNSAQALKVRQLCKTNPVVFMPSHRTYLDFLLLSLLCYEYEIPLPAIAAGMDFMSMAFVGGVLRRNGAFFMRRSFGKDRLYWAMFSEYCQTHLINADRPIEFFVEATRSRVGKSLHPKYGLLQILIEPYLRRNVYDITVVPVSMNYDRILEEMLYAYELLGFPKPKESTSGLLKATEVLKERFGKVFITFGDPISVRDMLGPQLPRSSFVCQPDSQFEMHEDGKKAIRRFGHYVVKQNDDNTIITVWPLVCMVMLQKLDKSDDQIFHYNQVHEDVSQLFHLLKRLNVVVNVSGTLDEDIRYYIKLHEDLFHPIDYNLDFELRLRNLPVDKEIFVEKDVMERAVSRLVLTTYSNVMMHGVVDTGYIASIILRQGLTFVPHIKREFIYITNLLKREFVFVPDDEDKMFTEALTNLQKSKIIHIRNDIVYIRDMTSLSSLKDLIMPYICHFAIIVSTLLDSSSNELTPQVVVRDVQKELVRRYELSIGIQTRLSFLSTEPIKNTFNTLIDMECIRREKNHYKQCTSNLRDVHSRLCKFTGEKVTEEIVFDEAKL